MMSGFQKTISGNFSHGNSAHSPQNCTWCSLVHACTLHRPDSAHSGTRPSASMHPGHLPSSFFGHSVQHSPQAVIVEKSVIRCDHLFFIDFGLKFHAQSAISAYLHRYFADTLDNLVRKELFERCERFVIGNSTVA